MYRGITLTIVPILVFGADQTDKIRSNTNQLCGDVISLHLNEVQDEVKLRSIIEAISSILANTKKNLLFSSPQAITNNRYRRNLILNIVNNGLLRLVCIDKVHLFLHYGL